MSVRKKTYTAKEFIKMKDEQKGNPLWSNDLDELAKVMEEYASLKVEEEFGKFI